MQPRPAPRRLRIPGLRISPNLLSNREYVRVLQDAWPVIAERFPCLSEEEDLYVEVAGPPFFVDPPMYVIHFVRLRADWAFSILRLHDQGVAQVRQMLGGLLQLPCWIDRMQAGLG